VSETAGLGSAKEPPIVCRVTEADVETEEMVNQGGIINVGVSDQRFGPGKGIGESPRIPNRENPRQKTQRGTTVAQHYRKKDGVGLPTQTIQIPATRA